MFPPRSPTPLPSFSVSGHVQDSQKNGDPACQGNGACSDLSPVLLGKAVTSLVLWTAYLCPSPTDPDSDIVTLILNVMVSGDGASGRSLGHEGGALVMALVPCKKRGDRACFLSLLSCALI